MEVQRTFDFGEGKRRTKEVRKKERKKERKQVIQKERKEGWKQGKC